MENLEIDVYNVGSWFWIEVKNKLREIVDGKSRCY